MVDYSKKSEKELLKMRGEIDRALAKLQRKKRTEAKKAAEAAAKKHGFSLNDLVGAAPAAPRAKRAAKRAPAAAKFRNPADGSQTWSGRGRQPQWYKDAIAAGKSPGDLAI